MYVAVYVAVYIVFSPAGAGSWLRSRCEVQVAGHTQPAQLRSQERDYRVSQNWFRTITGN